MPRDNVEILKSLTLARNNILLASMAIQPKTAVKRSVHSELTRVAYELAELSASLQYILTTSGIQPPDPVEQGKSAAVRAIRKIGPQRRTKTSAEPRS